MSRKSATRSERSRQKPANPSKAQATPSDGLIIHMKPQRTAFIVLLLMFAVWVGLLLALYFRTVRQPENADGPAAANARWALMSPTAGEPSASLVAR